jgi:hypothetical protein
MAVVVRFLAFQNLPKTVFVVPSIQSTETNYQTAEVSSSHQSVAARPVYRPLKTNSSDEGEGNPSLEMKKLTIAGRRGLGV